MDDGEYWVVVVVMGKSTNTDFTNDVGVCYDELTWRFWRLKCCARDRTSVSIRMRARASTVTTEYNNTIIPCPP